MNQGKFKKNTTKCKNNGETVWQSKHKWIICETIESLGDTDLETFFLLFVIMPNVQFYGELNFKTEHICLWN